MTKQEEKVIVDLTEVAVNFAAMKAEVECLKRENEFLKQIILKIEPSKDLKIQLKNEEQGNILF